jgi:hypothetical protein
MKKITVSLVALTMVTISLWGCASTTKRMNRRAESHVKYHASKQLECEEKTLTATCTDEFKSGECFEYEVIGCSKSIVYKNISGVGWTNGS